MINEIDFRIMKLLEIRDSKYVMEFPELRASVCNVIEKAYFLESLVLKKKRIFENSENQFFTAQSAVNRHFRDWNLEEVADIYDELRLMAKDYIENI